ncbi:heavy metal translocating P-type ATPase [Campylobacter geochelonis]|uniref:Copper-transporting ATPase n=1 Tax=Campylobacter geochelonis TaxID=1780362 RepID=A0A128EG93_9BACT|nr:heavy metal translocating P-type ATPase [Campylobacter geochelonis]QKF71905.1 cytochrome oxidase maturation protein, cbb3-type [Campylobacter geochelonis]CZE47900.1 copper-translocating P-type ATPase [Campylobacter geochelonis]
MSKEKCSHCQLSFEKDALIDDEFGNKFCCNGCKQVFYLLKNEGLDDFYKKLGKNTLNPASNLKEISDETARSIYKNYVKQNSDGFNEIYIIIEGIHCAACIWLNQKVLFNAKGVIEAEINASTNKAKIVWDESEINLAEIFNIIQSIGYNPYPYDPVRSQTRSDAKRRDFYARLLVGIFATMNIMWIAVALYSGYFSGMDESIKDVLHFAEFVLATPVLFYTGNVFLKGAITAVKTKMPNMDLLIFSGATLTYIYSLYAMFSRSGEVYFDSVCMIITFVFIGKYLEVISQKKAVDSLDALSNLVIKEIQVKNGDKFELKSANSVKIGDVILVNSGEMVLIDGKIISGDGSFDYASLSGESIPVFKQNGDEISSGAICLDGRVEYMAQCDFQSSILSKIINLLENASFKKPQIEKTVNKISGYFSLIILSLALLTFLAWFGLDFGFEKALIVAVSVIIVACPCALGLATPVATLVGLSTGLKKGIIYKETKIIESMAKCDTIVFDKTGTLTKAKLKVVNSEFYTKFDINLLANLLKSSNHPVSVAVFEHINHDYKSLNLSEFENIQAKGVSAKFSNTHLRGGSYKFMQELGLKCPNSDMTSYFFAIDDEVVAKFELEDILRDEAKDVVLNLANQGFEIYILSGDNEKVVKKIANELNITNFVANSLPSSKAEFVQNLSKNGKNVIMVGDGINDSVALSVATVGISFGSGASVSVDKSDVILVNENLTKLYEAILISKATLKTIKQNLALSILYNIIAIPLAMLGFIIPLFAALFMSLSSISVVLNSLKIKNIFKGNR